MTEFQKNKFLEVLNKWFFCQKKKVNWSCSKEHDWKNKNKQEKGRNNKGDGTKTVLQKRDEQNEKGGFFFLKKKKKNK